MKTIFAPCLENTWQSKPENKLVERIPVKEGKKLSTNKEMIRMLSDCTWKDLRGLAFVFEEDWF